jgi:hypothetical protein
LWDRIVPRIDVVPISPETLNVSLRYHDPFIAKYSYAHVADFVRLQILLEHGGVYADMDTLFVRPLPSSLFQATCVIGHERVDTSVTASSGGSLCNAFIMAESDAAFIRLWLSRMPGAFDGSWTRHSTFLPYELSVQRPDLIHTEPEESFFSFDWTPDGIANLFERSVQLPKGAYSLHLWAHLWWDRERQDFSRFSADQLTLDYVRQMNTTYANAARRFLPLS